MNHLLSILLTAILCASASAQTIKSLGYNTTNGQVVYSGTNNLQFTNQIFFGPDASIDPNGGTFRWGGAEVFNLEESRFATTLSFDNAKETRENLGAARVAIWARQTNNVTNDSNVTFTNTSLTFTAVANTKYVVELGVLATDNNGGAIDAKIVTSNAPTVRGYWRNTQTHVTNSEEFFQFEQGGGSQFAEQKFIVEAGTNNAPVTFQFKTQTLSYEVIINAGSYLKAEVIE